MDAAALPYETASLSSGTRRANVWTAIHSRSSRFGDLAVIAFFLTQAADGVLTYVGVQHFGPAVEANPLITLLIASFGEAGALTGAKLVAVLFGMALHLSAVHRVVAALAAFYTVVAVGPWVLILYLG